MRSSGSMLGWPHRPYQSCGQHCPQCKQWGVAESVVLTMAGKDALGSSFNVFTLGSRDLLQGGRCWLQHVGFWAFTNGGDKWDGRRCQLGSTCWAFVNTGDSEANEMGGVVFGFNVLDSGLSRTLVTARRTRQPALCLNSRGWLWRVGARVGFDTLGSEHSWMPVMAP